MNWCKTPILYITLALLLVGGLTSCGIKARVRKADKKYAIGEYYNAAEIYRQCYPRISAKKERELKAHVAFYQAECYRVLNNSKAVTNYQHAIKNKYTDSIAYLRLAQVLLYQGKYKEAEKNYKIYLEAHPYSEAAQNGIHSCQNIGEWKKQPTRYKVSLAKEFNLKRTSNFAPAYIGDEANALMFTSNRKIDNSDKKTKRNSPVTGQQTFNLFTSRKDTKGKWEEIQLPEGLYSDETEEDDSQETGNDSVAKDKTGTAELGACCFTADGKDMYFTFSLPVNGQDLGAKIYHSTRTGGEWGKAEEVKLFQDSSITAGHPAISANGDTLYFISDAKGGMGGKDIWRAEAIDGKWTNITNMGPSVNTTEDELFPTIRRDGRLYFSSNGHPGYGGLDLFVAIPQGRDTTYINSDSVVMKVPIYVVNNLGNFFNSNEDDFGITFAGNTEDGFFSSNRGQKKGFDQIYSFRLPELVLALEGTVKDNNGEPLSESRIRIIGDNGTNQKLQTRRDGTYRIVLQPNTHYVMLATSRGFLNQKQMLSTEENIDSRTYIQDFSLAPISKPVTMNNVFYETGKWELNESSSAELMGLLKMLEDNPNITIELSAHTDMVGDSTYNKTLSEKRARACTDFLISKGIASDRLKPVGYGKNQPVKADKTIHDKYSFIPTEQVLDEAFILTLPTEQQEICNQINRRTDFKVLTTTYNLY